MPAPSGTGAGFLGVVFVAMLLPLSTSMALGEWTVRGVDAWLDRLGWTFLLSFMIFLPPLLGWPGRHFWAICWFWLAALGLLLAYLPCLAITAAIPLGWRAPGIADEVVVADCAFAIALICLPFCYGLLRLVTLRYFQPWTRADQWEEGDYRAPGWAMAILRVFRPGIAASIDRSRVDRDHGRKR